MIKTWKQVIMQEMAKEIQTIRNAYKEALITPRHTFWIKLKRIYKSLDHIKKQSTMLVNAKTFSKSYEMAVTLRSTQDIIKIH